MVNDPLFDLLRTRNEEKWIAEYCNLSGIWDSI